MSQGTPAPRNPYEPVEVPVKVTGEVGKVTCTVALANPVKELSKEAASRPPTTAKGKYAHVLYGSEDFIREKRDEIDLEDR